eukprot:TRINITY_DN462_c0_g2_i1.p1 TRINITY_DN462_c0_g2~~TRINITY_DN462_c0_g2_i1.p1  ORF type:complete len:59 (-),score=5.47 TRINITY_DN462_c0_g2_i1:2-178(-)
MASHKPNHHAIDTIKHHVKRRKEEEEKNLKNRKRSNTPNVTLALILAARLRLPRHTGG